MSKHTLREHAKEIRSRLSHEEIAHDSTLIERHLLSVINGESPILIYVSKANEVDTRELIRALLRRGKTILVPLIVGPGIMEAHRIETFEDLAPGEFGILAPARPAPFEGTPDISICPGLAFSRRGDRLGRGAAYYDRFLAAHPRACAVALSYELQLVDEIPIGPGDMHVRLIVTEDRTIRVPAGR